MEVAPVAELHATRPVPRMVWEYLLVWISLRLSAGFSAAAADFSWTPLDILSQQSAANDFCTRCFPMSFASTQPSVPWPMQTSFVRSKMRSGSCTSGPNWWNPLEPGMSCLLVFVVPLGSETRDVPSDSSVSSYWMESVPGLFFISSHLSSLTYTCACSVLFLGQPLYHFGLVQRKPLTPHECIPACLFVSH